MVVFVQFWLLFLFCFGYCFCSVLVIVFVLFWLLFLLYFKKYNLYIINNKINIIFIIKYYFCFYFFFCFVYCFFSVLVIVLVLFWLLFLFCFGYCSCSVLVIGFVQFWFLDSAFKTSWYCYLNSHLRNVILILPLISLLVVILISFYTDVTFCADTYFYVLNAIFFYFLFYKKSFNHIILFWFIFSYYHFQFKTEFLLIWEKNFKNNLKFIKWICSTWPSIMHFETKFSSSHEED